jgi:hypothetical protein
MPPSAAKAIPPACPGISLPEIANANAESNFLMQTSMAEVFAG